MRRGGVAAAVLSAAAVILAVWVTSTGAIQLLPSTGRIPRLTPTSTSPPTSSPTRGKKTYLPGYHPSRHHGTPLAFTVVGYVLLGLILASGIAFLLTAAVRRSRRAKVRRGPTFVEPSEAIDALGVPPMIREAAERQLLVIRQGTPRNAIVACWLELERTCGDSGFPRAWAETSTEFTQRVLGRFAVSPGTILALAALYREARYSEHRLTEVDREHAVSALEQIAADLHRKQILDSRAATIA